MKKITLLATGLLLMGHVTFASVKNVGLISEEGYHFVTDYRNADPIVFNERGVEFLIFLDGQFDFNTQPTTPTRNRISSINRTYGAPGTRTVSVSNSYYGPASGVRVEHDNQGRVRRVGSVFINYDAYGRVKRIGSVYMKYNSFALKQVGGMKIFYNRRGQIVDVVGRVNGYNASNTYTFENIDYDNHNDFNNTNNEDFYYYRTDGSQVKMDENDIIEIKREELNRKR